jgi:hypothetical protein
MKKKKDPTDTNIVDDLFWALKPERKDREPACDDCADDDEDYFKQLEDKKRARREALQKKYEE